MSCGVSYLKIRFYTVFMKELSDTEILELSELKISEKQQELLSDLLAKSREGELTIEEEKQLDELITISEEKTLQKAEALRIAVERGLSLRDFKQETSHKAETRSEADAGSFINSSARPTILLLDNIDNFESRTTREWLEARGYNVSRVDSLIEVIEEIIDFTLKARPKMILLIGDFHSEVPEWLDLLSDIAQTKEIPLIAYNANEGELVGFEESILQVKNLVSFKSLIQNLLTVQDDKVRRAA